MYIPASQLHQIVVHQLPEPKKAKKTSPVKTRKLLKMLSRSTMDNKMVKLAETGVKDGAKVARKRVCKRAYRTAYRTAHRWAHRWAHRRVCRRTSCSVDVYKHCNYRGYRIHLTPGSYNMHALIRRGMKNDDLSSIRVHGRCVDRLYQHWNFGGRVLTKTRSDSCFTNDRMYIPLSQLHQLVIHEAPEPKKVQDGTKLVQRSWNDQISSIRVAGLSGTRCHTVRYRQRFRQAYRKAYRQAYTRCRWVHTTRRHVSFNDQVSSIRVYGHKARRCYRHRTCRHYCYMVPDGSEKRKKAAEKKMKESVGKKKEKAKKAELKHKEKTKKAVERSRKEKVYKEKMSKKEKQAKYVQKKEKKPKEQAAKAEKAKKEKAKKHKKEQAAKAEKAQKEKTKKEKATKESAAKAEKKQKENKKKELQAKEKAKKAEKRQKEQQLKEKKSKEKAKKAEKATKEAAEKYKAAKKVLEKIDASCKAQAKLKYKALERIKAVAKIVTSLTKTKTKACKAEKKAQEIAKKAKAKLVKARKNSKIAGPGFKFGKDPCKSGSNMFTQKLVLNQRVNVGIIPAGKVNVKIALNTDKDVDTELWTADGGNAVVAWQCKRYQKKRLKAKCIDSFSKISQKR